MFSVFDRFINLDLAGLKVLNGIAEYMSLKILGSLVVIVRLCIGVLLVQKKFRGILG